VTAAATAEDEDAKCMPCPGKEGNELGGGDYLGGADEGEEEMKNARGSRLTDWWDHPPKLGGADAGQRSKAGEWERRGRQRKKNEEVENAPAHPAASEKWPHNKMRWSKIEPQRKTSQTVI
jgi:hypothetical protein